MPWLILLLAGLFEVAWAIGLKYADGFSRLWPSVLTLAAMGYWSIMGPFWTLPTRILGGQAAAGGVAIITMVGGVGGFLGPFLTGRLRDLTQWQVSKISTLGARLTAMRMPLNV